MSEILICKYCECEYEKLEFDLDNWCCDGMRADLLEAENKRLNARVDELEADVLAELIEAPINERMLKDVYEENDRLKKAVEEAEKIMSDRWENSNHAAFIEHRWLSKYGKEAPDEL